MKRTLNKIKKIVQRNKFLIFRLPSSWKEPSFPQPNLLKVEEASPVLIKTLFREDPDRLKVFLRFIDLGIKGIIYYDGDKWASYAWMSCPGTMGPSHLPFVSKLNMYWIHYCRTREEFRNQGLYKQSLIRLCKMARSVDPFAKVYIDTETDNIPSIRAIQKVGFQPEGFIETLTINVPKHSFIIFRRWVRDSNFEGDSNK